jgi:hypothetical protein
MKLLRGIALIAASVGFVITSAAIAAENTQTFDVVGFTGIEVDGHVELNVSVGEKFFVEISGREVDMERLRVEVEDGVLRIYKERRKRGSRRGRSKKLHATIRLPKLNSLEIDGMSDAEIRNIDSDNFSLSVDGHGEINLSGKCGTSEIDVDGHAEIDGREFKCQNVSLDVDGHGEIEIYAGETLEVDIDGHGNVEIYGNPRIKKYRQSGMGQFEIKD